MTHRGKLIKIFKDIEYIKKYAGWTAYHSAEVMLSITVRNIHTLRNLYGRTRRKTKR